MIFLLKRIDKVYISERGIYRGLNIINLMILERKSSILP
jgi:hypothetical protein